MKGQKASPAVSVNGPHVPRSDAVAPTRIANTPTRHTAARKCLREPVMSRLRVWANPITRSEPPIPDFSQTLADFFLRRQNLTSWPTADREIQKFVPSLQMRFGWAPRSKLPSGVRSAAFQRDTNAVSAPVTRTLWPSKAAARPSPRPFPVSVARTAPLPGRTTQSAPVVGTQRFVPSKSGNPGPGPSVTVWRIPPVESSLSRVPRLLLVTQMLFPSKVGPATVPKPVVTVVTVHGIVSDGLMIETEPLLAVQTRELSMASPRATFPRLLATTVTAPGGRSGSMKYSWPGPPGLIAPDTPTFPARQKTPRALRAPVQVSRTFRSLPRTLRTLPSLESATQTSVPSDLTPIGLGPTVVYPRDPLVQNWSSAARLLPRSRTRSTVRERNAAIWVRVTLAVGS